MKLTFSAPMTAKAEEGRILAGQIVPFERPGNTSAGLVVFATGSIELAEDAPFILNLEHDQTRPVGKAVAMEVTPGGVYAKFKIAETTAGDDLLVEAAEGLRTGFSIEAQIDRHTVKGNTMHVQAARLTACAAVTNPAYGDAAQITEVAASEPDDAETPSTEGETAMTDQVTTVEETTAPAVEASAAPVYASQAVVREAFPYSGSNGRSFFADLLASNHDHEARARHEQAKTMLTAAQKSSDIAEIIPEGYRPDLYVSQLGVATPLLDAFQSFGLADARPFRVPRFVSATNMIADHVEGVNPTDGSLALEDITVSPSGVSGQYTISREAVLGAVPGIDMIIMNAIAQAVATKRETEFATALLADATGGTDIAAATATADFLGNILDYQDGRLIDPSILLSGGDVFRLLAAEKDGNDRPMNPYYGVGNSNGTLSANGRQLNVAGFGVGRSWALDTAAVALLGLPTDAASWWSGLQTWRWEEVDGPANIRFAAFGLHAYSVLRPAGIVKFGIAA